MLLNGVKWQHAGEGPAGTGGLGNMFKGLQDNMARRQRQSASASLIQGAGMVAKSQGFVNYAEAINVSLTLRQGENFYVKERERKEATKSRVNGYIANMKSNIDLDGSNS